MDTQKLQDFRRDKDDFFKWSAYSPLTPEQQDSFTALAYYDPNPDLVLTVTVDLLDSSDVISMETTTGDIQQYRRYGRFSFVADDQEAHLTIYEGQHSFFLPFVDAGAGTETYAAGRYLEPEYLGENRFRVNFNDAYHPYCAYNDGWSCPITPAENRLKVAIRAGEKLPTQH